MIKYRRKHTNSVIRIDLAYSLKDLYVPPLARSFSIKKLADSSISVEIKIQSITFIKKFKNNNEFERNNCVS